MTYYLHKGSRMEKKRWKRTAVSIATLIVLLTVLLLVFRDHYKEILANLRLVQITDILLLLGMGVTYQLLESAVCFVLVHSQQPEFKFWRAVEVTYLGVFGNVATFSIGTIPMQSYYLHQCGVMAGRGVGTMTLEYVFHKSSVLIYTTVMLLTQGRWLSAAGPGVSHYMVLAYVICALIIVALILLCACEKVLHLVLWLIGHIPDTEKWRHQKQLWSENIEALYMDSQRILHNRGCLWKVVVLNILKLFCLYSIPFFCLRMLNIPTLSFWRVQLLTALMHLIANALPNLAGVGPVEFAFLLIFSNYINYAQTSSILILYRTATYFFPFAISSIFALCMRGRTAAIGRTNSAD